jgi:hypothetical protein
MKQQCNHNARARRDSSSGIRGVRRRKGSKGWWIAECSIAGQRHYLGTFDTAEEANKVVTAERRAHMPYSLMDKKELV